VRQKILVPLPPTWSPIPIHCKHREHDEASNGTTNRIQLSMYAFAVSQKLTKTPTKQNGISFVCKKSKLLFCTCVALRILGHFCFKYDCFRNNLRAKTMGGRHLLGVGHREPGEAAVQATGGREGGVGEDPGLREGRAQGACGGSSGWRGESCIILGSACTRTTL